MQRRPRRTWDARDPRGPLEPQVAALFDLLRLVSPEPILDPEPLRRFGEAVAARLQSIGPAVAAEREIRIPAPHGSIRARVYVPPGAVGSPRPVLLYFHGGGFMVGSPESYSHVTRPLCLDSDALVVSVDYRLAPEHPFPAAIQDGLQATRWVRAHAAELGGDPERVALAGNSAGGNLAVAVSLELRNAGEPQPRALGLICPWLDLTLSSESIRHLASDDPILARLTLEYLRGCYRGDADPNHPLLSPLFADLEDLPPAVLIVGDIDPLYCDAVRFAEKLEACGGRAWLRVSRGMPHDFPCFPGLDGAEEALREMAGFLRARLNEPPSASPL